MNKMSVSATYRNTSKGKFSSGNHKVFKLAPIASAIAMVVATSSVTSSAHAQQVFSRAWYGKQQQHMQQMRATGVLPNGQPITNPQQQQQQSRDQLERSWGNVNRAAQALAASLNAQQIARNNGGNVPVVTVTDGVGGNGLVVDLSKAWQNATLKTPVTENGQTKVTIDQDAARAIAYWDSFNVGKNTHVHFDQHGNSDWAILNKVSNSVAPSQIQGKVTADGTVLIVNNNGVVFTGTSQINVRNLVAAATNMSDTQFNNYGIYSNESSGSLQAAFTNAAGQIVVQEGAQIVTRVPTSATQGGGYVLLVGQQVLNEGEIQTEKGQTLLAAGDSFVIKKGVSTEGNLASTTKGNEVVAQFNAGSLSGEVINRGVIIAKEGDITLAGNTVRQEGLAVATTTVNTRGTIHLNAFNSTENGSVTLASDAITAILIDYDGKTTALDSQRDALVKGVTIDNTVDPDGFKDRLDQSRIEINSADSVTFEGDSLALATGGQIAVNAKGRVFVADKAELDVSGAVGVSVSMASNNIKINIQGNELRDSPVNRDNGSLINGDVWVDRRDLILVPAGTGGYTTDRWYTSDGLLEVAGYLDNQGHTIGEWATQGGTVALAGNEIVTQAGSVINLAGGTLDVATGYVAQTWLKGSDGNLYTLSNLPAGMTYTGVHKGFEVNNTRWGVTKSYYNPLLARDQKLENGYTVGRDAGTLIISAPTAVLEGTVDAQVFNGSQQTRVRDAVSDGYQQAQTAVAKQGQIVLGQYNRYGKAGLFDSDVLIGDVANVTAGMQAGDAISADRVGTVWLDAASLNEMQLGGLVLGSRDGITIDEALILADGGNITLTAATIDLNADVTARGGSLVTSNLFTADQPGSQVQTLTNNGQAYTSVGHDVTIDMRGQWVNVLNTPEDAQHLAYLNGGSVTLSSTQDVIVGQGSVIDVSSGGAVVSQRKQTGGKGGHVSLLANQVSASANGNSTGTLVLDGTVRSYGVSGGGKLAIETGDHISIGDASGSGLYLDTARFASGFASYDINGHGGVTVADNTTLNVTMPVYRFTADAQYQNTVDGGLELWTPPAYLNDVANNTLVQRKGADITLQSKRQNAGSDITIGHGATIAVDDGRSISIIGGGLSNIVVEGTLRAAGGNIAINVETPPPSMTGNVTEQAHARAIVIGQHAVLDASGDAMSVTGASGRQYGFAQDGGHILIGGALDWEENGQATTPDVAVVIKEGALLDASGASAVLDITNGTDIARTTVAGDGGEIVIKSMHSLYLDGTMRAQAGGAGAAGGTLAIALETPVFQRSGNPDDAVRAQREFILTQDYVNSGLSAAWQPEQTDAAFAYGQGRLSAQQISDGGFDNMSLLVNGIVSFDGDVTLHTKQSLRLFGGAYALPDNAAANTVVNLDASYVKLAAATRIPLDGQMDFGVTWRDGMSSQVSDATLNVSADLIDIRDRVGFGAKGTIQKKDFSVETIDRRGFNEVVLNSSGDIRLLEGLSARGLSGDTTTELANTGNITLTAAQIYPATNAHAQIVAGLDTVSGALNYKKDSLLAIYRNSDIDPAMPSSAFGALKLGADIVSQAGVVRAPLGNIELGADARGGYQAHAIQVLLKEGSITSVSGDGLVMPYGGTIDGLEYAYNGQKFTPPALASNGITLTADSVIGEEGSVLDLSGGGELIGAGFISGRGGSVNIINTPLANAGIVHGYSSASNQVYAIVPGNVAGYAPVASETGAGMPLIGQQITLTSDVGGLKAGTYTLMPSTYAVLPGAYRVEIGAVAAATGSAAATTTGSYVGTGYLGIANTDIRKQQANSIIVTSSDVVKQHSNFNTMSLNAFVISDVARHGGMRGKITSDAATLNVVYNNYKNGELGLPVLQLEGLVDLSAKSADEGFAGALSISGYNIEILAAGQQKTAGWGGVSLYDDILAGLNVPRIIIGGTLELQYGDNFAAFKGIATNVVVRSGATLTGADVFLVSTSTSGGITIEQGASIVTAGQGKSSYDSTDGVFFSAGTSAVVAVSNGWINLMSPYMDGFSGPGFIDIGGCASLNCTGDTRIISDGTFAAATDKTFTLDDNVRYGAKHLVLSLSSLNLGSEATLAQAANNGQLAAGLSMNQTILSNLLKGNTGEGMAAVETLMLNASQAVNIYGSVDLNTIDGITGHSSIERFVLGTPAIYGYGDADDRAVITTGEFVWAGSASVPGAAIGSLLGNATLDINAERIVLGNAPQTQVNSQSSYDRLVAGFNTVNLNATEMITANSKGRLSVYQQQGSYDSQSGYAYTGGHLNLFTPVLTGDAGSSMQMTAGGQLLLQSDNAVSGTQDALGATIGLKGETVTIDGRIAAASGKVTLEAVSDVTLTDNAMIDLAGRAVNFYEQTRYSKGGDLIIGSTAGNVTQAAGSVIDVSATHNHAGTVKVTALGETAGHVTLDGQLLGSSSGTYNTGGTVVPYSTAELTLRAQTVDDFAGLNTRLTDSNVLGARRFQIKQGDLVIGDEVRASIVEIVADGGDLTVNGRIDASGFEVGEIRLAAKDDLVINGVLDAHGTGLRVDSYGKIIDSPNRAIVDLTAKDGTLILGTQAQIDVRADTDNAQGNVKLGTVSLNAPRLGSNDVAVRIDAAPVILGAKTVSVNAFRTYDDAPLVSVPDVSGTRPQQITQAYLNKIDTDSRDFIDAALLNTALTDRLDLLGEHQLRPGVDIISNALTNPDGNIIITEDIDLSGYRYGPDADTGKRGFGTAGVLAIRPAGDLTVYGSINDGFAPPPDTPDDNGWMLTETRYGGTYPTTPYGQDIVVPIDGVILDTGTQFRMGAVLNYDVPLAAFTALYKFVLPADAELGSAVTFTAGTVLSGNVYDANGSVRYAAGTVMPETVTLYAGTKLGAGIAIASGTVLNSILWPQGHAFPQDLFTSAAVTLPRGGVIPSMTLIELPNDEAVYLRPVVNGKQGKNWALAAMLEQGASSWDVQLTAGADLLSADRRAVNPEGKGSVILADTHTMNDGKMALGGSGVVWTLAGALYWHGDASAAGKLVEDWEMDLEICSWGENLCEIDPSRIQKVWGEIVSDFGWGVPGEVVEEYYLTSGFCEFMEGLCVDNILPVRDVYTHTYYAPAFSVVRTGTGDLTITAAKDLRMDSPYGVYTAGTPSDAIRDANGVDQFNLPNNISASQSRDYAASLANYQAWYPEHGGNLTISVGNNITSDSWGYNNEYTGVLLMPSSIVGNWLWRQGTGNTEGITSPVSTAWWINFGSYVAPSNGDNIYGISGFTGLGTLGGGDVTIDAGGDAGLIAQRGPQQQNMRSQGLVVAVGSTGRVDQDGQLVLTGGGDLQMRVAGAINPDAMSYQFSTGITSQLNHTLQGAIVNLRGLTAVSASQVGDVSLNYRTKQLATSGYQSDKTDPRVVNPFEATVAVGSGGIVLVPGDSAVYLDTTSDLVLATVGDATRVFAPNKLSYSTASTSRASGGQTWFSLWTDNTAINLFSAGGNLVPGTETANTAMAYEASTAEGTTYVYPSVLRAIAASGSVYFGYGAAPTLTRSGQMTMLAPSANSHLELLAGEGIFGSGYGFGLSGSDVAISTPFNPAFIATNAGGTIVAANTSLDGTLVNNGNPQRGAMGAYPYFAFGPDTVRTNDLHANSDASALFYAVNGDILGLGSGLVETRNYGTWRTWYRAAMPVRVKAGRDIVGANIFALNNDATDVTLLQAGRDIVQSTVKVAGPGTLELLAGRHITQNDVANIESIGGIVSGDTRLGADVILMAGMAEGVDFTAIRQLYLDPQYQADAALPLAEQPGKVARTYEEELAVWLNKRYDFSGNTTQALAYFDGLAPEQQRIFLRDVYYSELKEGAREFNNPDSLRYQSYLRSRQMIATLFPDQDAVGNVIHRTGNITMFGDMGVHTNFGGDIQMMAPGGQLVLGTQQASVPEASAGLVTQGQGDIQLFTEQSILLGLSRIMTTFGGHIFAWSEEGDINAGRGAKTTVLYTPPKRVYDELGNVTMSPQVPSSGAGIATLNPIAEIVPGDVDLVAPLGTIDAGEAGIRVSGSINVIANQVINSENIKVQGDSAGLPVIASANIGALTSATAASSAAAIGAQEMLQRDRANARDNLPSVFTVRVLGFGNEPPQRSEQETVMPSAAVSSSSGNAVYNPNSMLQIVGHGDQLKPELLSQLSDKERQLLQKGR